LATLCQSVTNRKKEGLFGMKITHSVSDRIKDVDFIGIQEPFSTIGFVPQYITLDTFDSYVMPLVHKVALQMDEKGYLVEGDAEQFVQIAVHGTAGSSGLRPLAHVKKEGLEAVKSGNTVATMRIGSHSEFTLAHLFKNLYSELVALERAKKGESLYVRLREFA
jgi:hypothetical protein